MVLGPRTKVAYYDQLRTHLDDEQTVYEAAWDEEYVQLGKKRVRLADYLDDLLFPVPMQKMKVKALSGGERNRLLLARLFLEGANVLVLDEPTNDLDLVTLNVLERLLLDFEGAVLLVTHDRYFLDKVATALLVFEGDGKVVRYEGNYDMYRRLSGGKKAPAPQKGTATVSKRRRPRRRRLLPRSPRPRRPAGSRTRTSASSTAWRRPSRRPRRRRPRWRASSPNPAVFSNATEAARISGELQVATKAVEQLYWRWQELQSLLEG